MNAEAHTTKKEIAKYGTLEESRTALARVKAVQTAVAVQVIYEMAVDVARELLSDQPLPFLANLVGQDGAGEGTHLMTLLSPEQAAEAILAAVVETGGKTVEYRPVGIDQVKLLVKEGFRKSVRKLGGKFWWIMTVGDTVSEDMAYHQIRLILAAGATDEWKIEVLDHLGCDFIAFAYQSKVDDADGRGLLIERIAQLDPAIADAVRATLSAKDFGTLHDDVLFSWKELVKSGQIVAALPAAGEPAVEVSQDTTIGDLIADIE